MISRLYEVVTPIYNIFEKKPILVLLCYLAVNRCRFVVTLEKSMYYLQCQERSISGNTSNTKSVAFSLKANSCDAMGWVHASN